jgi:hypothetical protein
VIYGVISISSLNATVRKKNFCLFLKEKYLEEYMVLNMEMGNGIVRQIEN